MIFCSQLIFEQPIKTLTILVHSLLTVTLQYQLVISMWWSICLQICFCLYFLISTVIQRWDQLPHALSVHKMYLPALFTMMLLHWAAYISNLNCTAIDDWLFEEQSRCPSPCRKLMAKFQELIGKIHSKTVLRYSIYLNSYFRLCIEYTQSTV